jgi:hypothetical protein
VGVESLLESENRNRERKADEDSDVEIVKVEPVESIKVDGAPAPYWWLIWEQERREHLAALNERNRSERRRERRELKEAKKRSLLMVSARNEDDGTIGALHPLDYVGIDTCSARSVSTEIADFLYLDRSHKARNSVSLNGIGEGGPEVLGRGPMLVSTRDIGGKQTFMLDPAGVLLACTNGQSRLRIFGQQRMKRFGFCVVQSQDCDKLIYRDTVEIPMETKHGILMVKTIPWCLDCDRLNKLNDIVDSVVSQRVDHYCFQIGSVNHDEELDQTRSLPLLVINEANLSRVEMDRLNHWRHAHRSSSGERYTEKCPTCEASKHKSTYKRNHVFNGTSPSSNIPYWRLYSDAYGGQKSMGSESYEGGIGGFVFAYPVSGTIKAKIYSSLE